MIFHTHRIKVSRLRNLSSYLIILIVVVLSVSVSDSREVSSPPKEELTEEFIQPNPCDLSAIKASLASYYRSDSQELQDRLNLISKYQSYISSLSSCTNPPSGYTRDIIKSLRLYFAAFVQRSNAENDSVIDSQTRTERYLQALDLIDEAIVLNDTSAAFYNERGIVYELLEFPGEAARNYEKAISIRNKWAVPHSNLGNALLRMDHGDSAKSKYRDALNLDGSLALAKVNFAQTLIDTDSSSAITMLNSVPADKFILQRNLAFAQLEIKRGNDAGAEYIYNNLDASVQDSKGHGNRGLAHVRVKNNNIQQAIRDLEKTYTNTPLDIDAAYHHQLRAIYLTPGLNFGRKMQIRTLLEQIRDNTNMIPEGYAQLYVFEIVSLPDFLSTIDAKVHSIAPPSNQVDFLRRVAVELYNSEMGDVASSIADKAINLHSDNLLAQRMQIDINVLNLSGNLPAIVSSAYDSLDHDSRVALSQDYLCLDIFYYEIWNYIPSPYKCQP